MTEQNIDTDITVAVCANEVYRRFREYIDRDDLVQEGRLWLLSHARLLDEYVNDEDVKRGRYRLRRDIMVSMERVARSEKAQRLGYAPEDEQFYGERTVGDEALGKLLEWTLVGPPVMEQALQEFSSSSAPDVNFDGMDLVIMTADIKKALAEVFDGEERQLFWDYYAEGHTLEEVGAIRGVTNQAISKRLKGFRRRLADYLGGASPWYRDRLDPEPDENRPKIRSNRSGVNQLPT